MKNISKNELQMRFEIIQNECKELRKYSLHYSDIRCGKRVALAIVNNTIDVKTEFMLFNEFISFLNGYYAKSMKKY